MVRRGRLVTFGAAGFGRIFVLRTVVKFDVVEAVPARNVPRKAWKVKRLYRRCVVREAVALLAEM